MNPPPNTPLLHIQQNAHKNAAGTAIEWLNTHHRKAWLNASESLGAQFFGRHPHNTHALGDEALEMFAINVSEWLLARGSLLLKGKKRLIKTLLLGNDGPYFNSAQQQWIAQLAERPLRLYRVTDVRVGEGMMLVDELNAAADPITVQERTGSQTASVGMLIGARVMHLVNHLEFSGATYPFGAMRERAVIEHVRAALGTDTLGTEPLTPQTRQQAELGIARHWLAQWLEPAPMPELRDAMSGEPTLLITDHYQVNDMAVLERALSAKSDVEGDVQTGWTRFVNEGDRQSSIAAINMGKAKNRIEVFYRTQGYSDVGRAWFEAVAGNCVKYLIRDIVDPRSALKQRSSGKQTPTQKQTTIPPEAMTEMMAQFLHKHYANWADEPIPALDNQTPRQAMNSPSGLERVKGLLRSYEQSELDMAKADGRAPVSYQFLWDALGLSR